MMKYLNLEKYRQIGNKKEILIIYILNQNYQEVK